MYINVPLIRKLLYAFHGQFMLPKKNKTKKTWNYHFRPVVGKKSSIYNQPQLVKIQT